MKNDESLNQSSGSINSAKLTIIPLMINKNNPRVKIVNGNEIILIIGFTNLLSREITKAKIIATHIFFTSTPGKIICAINIATVRTNNFILFFFIE